MGAEEGEEAVADEVVAALLKPLDGAEVEEWVVTVVEGPLTVGFGVVRKERSKSVTEKEDFE